MKNFDEFSNELLEEAKRFLEKAKESNTENYTPYLHASLLLSISSLEAFVNSIAEDFFDSPSLTLYEKAFLKEREIVLCHGRFEIDSRLKMSRLLERIEFLFRKFDYSKLDKRTAWWQNLNEGILLRNNLVHPKQNSEINTKQIESTIRAVLECVDRLFKAIYKRGLPVIARGLDSKLDF